jgi:hypothetical protein
LRTKFGNELFAFGEKPHKSALYRFGAIHFLLDQET